MIVVGRLGQRREIGRFRGRELVHRLVEIQERGGGDAVGAHAEIDLVEIKLEDSLLGESPLDLHRQQRFLDLARERQLVGQQEVLGDLLGDGRGALRTPPAAVLLHEQHRGARDAGEVDAAVLVVILVFRGDEGIGDKLGHGLDRNVEPPLARVFGEQGSVGGVHPRHHRGLVVLELGIFGKRLGIMPEQSGRGGHSDNEQDRSCCEQQAQETQHQSHAEVPPAPTAPAAIFLPKPRGSQPNIRSRQMSPVIATPAPVSSYAKSLCFMLKLRLFGHIPLNFGGRRRAASRRTCPPPGRSNPRCGRAIRPRPAISGPPCWSHSRARPGPRARRAP